jgi:hypothetical protein
LAKSAFVDGDQTFGQRDIGQDVAAPEGDPPNRTHARGNDDALHNPLINERIVLDARDRQSAQPFRNDGHHLGVVIPQNHRLPVPDDVIVVTVPQHWRRDDLDIIELENIGGGE